MRKKDTIVAMDDNLNTLSGNCRNNIFDNKLQSTLTKLQDERMTFVTKNSIIIHNKEPTYFKNNYKSTIDHIYSNCAYKIHNVKTDHVGSSDHSVISCTYKLKQPILSPKYFIKREHHLLTKHLLNQYFNANEKLTNIFSLSCPNEIAECLMTELNLIIDTIAPTKKVQVAGYHASFLNKDIRSRINKRAELFKRAISTNNISDWRE